jgi:hypothetical protein
MMKHEPRTTSKARKLAADAADRYFRAIASEIPFDSAPGCVDLIAAANAINDAIVGDEPPDANDEHDSKFDAGYLLGVEIGRRLRA